MSSEVVRRCTSCLRPCLCTKYSSCSEEACQNHKRALCRRRTARGLCQTGTDVSARRPRLLRDAFVATHTKSCHSLVVLFCTQKSKLSRNKKEQTWKPSKGAPPIWNNTNNETRNQSQNNWKGVEEFWEGRGNRLHQTTISDENVLRTVSSIL